MVSAVIMLCITIISSTLTTKIRNIEKLKAETEKEKMILELWNCLNSKNKDLALQIMRYLAQWQEEVPEA